MAVRWEGWRMWTTLLAYLVAFMGFIAFFGGALGLFILLFEEVGESRWANRIETGAGPPLRYYAMVVGLMAGGISMIGIAQALRLLLLIVAK
jgi:hypothetical protein